MPLLEVKIMEGRSLEQKKLMIEKITDVLVDTIQADREACRIHVVELTKENYAIGGKIIADR